jgi:AraC-like DNA-binding protein
MHKNLRIRQTGFDNRYNSWHTINRNMILYIHSGSGSIVSRERNYPIAPGCLCFVGSNCFYYTLPDAPGEYVRSKIFLSNEALAQVLRLFPETLHLQQRYNAESMVYAQTDPVTALQIAHFFDALDRYPHRDDYQDALIASGFTRLLIDLNENATDSVYSASGIVQKAVEYINSHICDDIRIDSICSAIHVSKYYFCKKFKQATGLTVMEYILKTRIISAKNMLESTDLTVGQVSDRCGFSSQSYFCRVFREDTGTTPLQYQKSLRSKNR